MELGQRGAEVMKCRAFERHEIELFLIRWHGDMITVTLCYAPFAIMLLLLLDATYKGKTV